ncbi:hypothetical protein N7478_004807 [Penicillium angulare]|uniref:uncharacterized protein n=1 Tax=Penicillium angulare TaxID=116970 RepID=UPI00254240C7|nr:uncharacterized protein N7478_004807 [Penicillium angulare]KAJ5279435.1 hypothetical protein N7478_004807 [Penicillium angulare]
MVNNSVRANKPIVAIAINYRVNGFGFMGGPILRDQGLANLGLRDQRLAFQWIQENIKNFGGDSSKVTIWGQSAGAGSVGAQLLAFGGRNDSLFRGAITDSGGPLGVQGPSNATQLSTWNHVLNSTGCAGSSDPIICLRGVSLDKFICAVNSSSVSFGPAYDGDFFVTYNSAQVSNGDFLKVPLITGSNTDEGTEFVGSASYIGALPAVPYPDEASFLQVVNSSLINPAFTQNALAVISALYPDIPAIGAPHTYIGRLNSTFGSQYARVASFSGDVKIIAGRRFTAQQWAKHGVPVYSYRFNQWPIGGLPDTTGTTHFTEVPLVMDDEPGNGYIAPWYPAGSEYNGMDANFTAMAHLMSRMWISFVHDLDPNNHGVTHHNGYPISNWKTYASNGSEALDGYGTNLQVSSSLPGLAEQEPDTWRAEAINYLIQHSYALFGA